MLRWWILQCEDVGMLGCWDVGMLVNGKSRTRTTKVKMIEDD
jgi:hypothetical protein